MLVNKPLERTAEKRGHILHELRSLNSVLEHISCAVSALLAKPGL